MQDNSQKSSNKKQSVNAINLMEKEAQKLQSRLSQLKSFIQEERTKRTHMYARARNLTNAQNSKIKNSSRVPMIQYKVIQQKDLTTINFDKQIQQESQQQTKQHKSQSPSKFLRQSYQQPLKKIGQEQQVDKNFAKVAQKQQEQKQVQMLQKIEEPIVTSKKENEVYQFLQKIGLSQYASLLIRNGFDDMETLMDVDDEILQSLHGQYVMPVGHRIKLIKKLEQFKLQHSEYQEDKSKFKTLPPIQQAQIENQQKNIAQGLKKNNHPKAAMPIDYNYKFEADYNPQMYHEAFQMFQKQKGTYEDKEGIKKQNQILEQKNQQQVKNLKFRQDLYDSVSRGSLYSKSSDSSKRYMYNQQQKSINLPSQSKADLNDQKTPSATPMDVSINKDRLEVGKTPESEAVRTPQSQRQLITCWRCQKEFSEEPYKVLSEKKQFCSKVCFRDYIKSNTLSCIICSKVFFRFDGMLKNGEWYCGNSSCAKKISSIQEEKQKEEDQVIQKNFNQAQLENYESKSIHEKQQSRELQDQSVTFKMQEGDIFVTPPQENIHNDIENSLPQQTADFNRSGLESKESSKKQEIKKQIENQINEAQVQEEKKQKKQIKIKEKQKDIEKIKKDQEKLIVAENVQLQIKKSNNE